MSDLLDIMSAPYPQAAGFKHTDTSKAAARACDAAGIRAKVLDAMRHHGDMTADECADRLRMDKLSIRPRCSELRELGQLFDSGIRRANASSGKKAIVWSAANQGAVQ